MSRNVEAAQAASEVRAPDYAGTGRATDQYSRFF